MLQDPPTIGVECRECHTSFTILYKDHDPKWTVERVKKHIVDLLYIHLLERHPLSQIVNGVPPDEAKKKLYEWLVDFPPPFPHETPYVSPLQTSTVQTH